jgi:hypothetical protein
MLICALACHAETSLEVTRGLPGQKKAPRTWKLTEKNATFSTSGGDGRTVVAKEFAESWEDPPSWTLRMTGPAGGPLRVGSYMQAGHDGLPSGTQATLILETPDSQAGVCSGQFEVLQVSYFEDGTLRSFGQPFPCKNFRSSPCMEKSVTTRKTPLRARTSHQALSYPRRLTGCYQNRCR